MAAEREGILLLWACREMSYIPASFSALAPSEIVHCSGIAGLTIRQPKVVEYSCWCACE